MVTAKQIQFGRHKNFFKIPSDEMDYLKLVQLVGLALNGFGPPFSKGGG